jgi:hypothetical protein
MAGLSSEVGLWFRSYWQFQWLPMGCLQ